MKIRSIKDRQGALPLFVEAALTAASTATVATTATTPATAVIETATATATAATAISAEAATATTAAAAATTAFTVAATAATTFSTEAATTTTAALLATPTGFACFRRIDAQGTAAKVLTIQGLDCQVDFCRVFQRHEAEASWSSSFTVRDQFHPLHRSKFGEELGHLFLGGSEGQVAHVDVHVSVGLKRAMWR
ncbi:hypothetical protein HNR46_002616 [Haloferula luteola]|uniref:Uncharacterized protein n=1 Tax=Haloferula luteola TaxID=595692 RepID=A0A840VI16_9BACT|nr:hypothetical protein [Haloferula luteola]